MILIPILINMILILILILINMILILILINMILILILILILIKMIGLCAMKSKILEETNSGRKTWIWDLNLQLNGNIA